MLKIFFRALIDFFYFFFNFLPYKLRKKIVNYLVYKINIENKPGQFRYFKEKKLKKKIIIFDVGSFDGRSIDEFLSKNNNIVIHAFEPNPHLFLKLSEKYKNNNKIILNKIALSNINKLKSFYINSFEETSSLNRLNLKRERKDKNFTKSKLKVKCMTLDYYINKNKIKKIDLLKLDTQGNESKILEGAKKTLSSRFVEYIKLEIIFENYYKKQNYFFEIDRNLFINNYKLLSLEDLKYSSDFEILQLDAIYKLK